jgi:hypothetical protein
MGIRPQKFPGIRSGLTLVLKTLKQNLKKGRGLCFLGKFFAFNWITNMPRLILTLLVILIGITDSFYSRKSPRLKFKRFPLRSYLKPMIFEGKKED